MASPLEDSAPDEGSGAPSRTSLLLARLRDFPESTVEQLVAAAYPELEVTQDPIEARKLRVRGVAILGVLKKRGRIVRLGRGKYALPAVKNAG